MEPKKCETCEVEVVEVETIHPDDHVEAVLYDYPPSRGVVVDLVESFEEKDSGSVVGTPAERGLVRDVYEPHVCDTSDPADVIVTDLTGAEVARVPAVVTTEPGADPVDGTGAAGFKVLPE